MILNIMASNWFARHLIIWNNFVKTYLPWGPTKLLGATHAPLDHYFIFRILKNILNTYFKNNNLKNILKNTIMLRCIFLKYPKIWTIKKKFQIVLLVSKLLLCNIYVVFTIFWVHISMIAPHDTRIRTS